MIPTFRSIIGGWILVGATLSCSESEPQAVPSDSRGADAGANPQTPAESAGTRTSEATPGRTPPVPKPVSDVREVAKLPYLELAGMLRQINGLFQKADVDFEFELRITSKQEGVSPDEIEVNIEYEGGSTPVKLAPDGFLDLPVKGDYLKPDCFLTTNQPKGTLDLGMSFLFGKAKLKPSSTVAYADMFKFMEDLNKVAPDLGKLLGKPLTLDRVTSVPYRMQVVDGQKVPASLTIRAARGEIVCKPNGGGVVEVPYSAALMKENPAVSIPAVNMAMANDALWPRLLGSASPAPDR